MNTLPAKCWAVRFPVGRGRPAPVSPNNCGARSPAGAGLLAHRLFRRYDLVDGRPFGLCVIALLICVVSELVNDARTSLLLDPSLLRFLLRGEDLVVYFVAH